MAGFSQKSVKVALEMASEAIESKQKVIDMLQIEIKEYKTRLEQYDQIHRDAQQLVYGVDHGSQETEA